MADEKSLIFLFYFPLAHHHQRGVQCVFHFSFRTLIPSRTSTFLSLFLLSHLHPGVVNRRHDTNGAKPVGLLGSYGRVSLQIVGLGHSGLEEICMVKSIRRTH